MEKRIMDREQKGGKENEMKKENIKAK